MYGRHHVATAAQCAHNTNETNTSLSERPVPSQRPEEGRINGGGERQGRVAPGQ